MNDRILSPSLPTPLPANSSQPHRNRSGIEALDQAKLALLQEHDRGHSWRSLHEQRTCVACGAEFCGRQIRVSARGGKPAFQCPTPNCRAGLKHFVQLGNPLLSEEVWHDWMRSLTPEASEAGED